VILKPQNSREGTEENQEISQSRYLVTRPTFEKEISRIKFLCVTATWVWSTTLIRDEQRWQINDS
jgi:hypothetical protein